MPQSVLNQAVARAGKRKELTEKQKAFLENYVASGFQDAQQCALSAGYSESTSRQVVYQLKDEMIELAEMYLVEHAARASKTIVDVMTSDEGVAQASAKMDAAKTVLNSVGLGKKEKIDVSHNVSGGIFILPSKTRVEAIEGDYTEMDE